jgi:hypothetical protein
MRRDIRPESLNIMLAEHRVSEKSDHPVDPAIYADF